MPKIIELTVELEVQKVSCPGVWLCQDGRVSLTVFLLGTSYQTCMLPPIFPLMFKDVFYFRKRFQESCALNNICCILKDETIYCELVQWCDDCHRGDCTVLAQYLGTLNDVVFPPNMCSSDGVDLLMRRSKKFPGILSPKIEIATKVRIDEVWDQAGNIKALKATSCHCTHDADGGRQRQVCHSAQYHRSKCYKHGPSAPRHRSRSQGSTRSCCSLAPDPGNYECPPKACPAPAASRASLCTSRRPRRRAACYNVYNVQTNVNGLPRSDISSDNSERDECARAFQDTYKSKPISLIDEDKIQKHLLESRFIDQEPVYDSKLIERDMTKHIRAQVAPCVCEICRRYHDLFHKNDHKRMLNPFPKCVIVNMIKQRKLVRLSSAIWQRFYNSTSLNACK